MASPNLSELVTTTLRNRTKKIADNVSDNNALLSKLSRKGRVMTFSGGREIAHELSYQENQTFKWYSGYETLDNSPSDVLTTATYAIRQASVAVTMSGLEEIQNAGKEQMIGLMSSRINVAQATMKNNISVGIYSDGTASAGKQIDGLNLQVPSTNNTGTNGGINRSTYAFWRNQTQTEANLTKDNIEAAMTALWVKCVRGMDHPDLIPADNTSYSAFLQSLTDRQRFVKDGGMAKLGWPSLAFQQGEVVLDGGIDGQCPANTMFFLNTDYLAWRPHSRRNMVPLRKRFATNQDATVTYLAFAGNLCLSNASVQGRLN